MVPVIALVATAIVVVVVISHTDNAITPCRGQAAPAPASRRAA